MPTVTTAAELDAAIQAIDLTGTLSAPNTGYAITLAADITLPTDLTAINLASGDTLSIIGNGHTLDGGGFARGLFVYAGSVDVQSLSIANAVAGGGDGADGGGGGAGLGGGLFVAAAGTVTLAGVDFASDQATGGAGGANTFSSQLPGGGGGGGLGGNGGTGSFYGNGGGGGGVGREATGGNAIGSRAAGLPGGAGILQGAAPGMAGGDASYTTGGPPPPFRVITLSGGSGGAGGGGGGSGAAGGVPPEGGVGRGGAGGASGFGGGGGGGYGSAGGFGGGGGSGSSVGGPGGFGGGGAGAGFNSSGSGGFGAGNGTASGGAPAPITIDGGGGLGAGGAVFVQQGGSLTIAGGTLSGGIVTGGTGVDPGSAFGDGIFLQGDEAIILAPQAGQTLSIANSIADEHGSIASYGASGTLDIEGAGTVILSAVNTYSGGTTIADGTLDLAVIGAQGSGSISFNGSGTLKLDVATAPANTISGLSSGTTLDLTQLPFAIGAAATLISANVLAVSSGGVTVDLNVAAIASGSTFQTTLDAGTGTAVTIVACFAPGTRLLSASGEVAVEKLASADVLVTMSGRLYPVQWIGHRRIELARHPKPHDVGPVRVQAHAFGSGMPHRDLVVSPDHALYFNGVLIPARCLCNDATILQEQVQEMTYYHVELPAHDVILAEGLPCETYLDTGNRAAFAGGDIDEFNQCERGSSRRLVTGATPPGPFDLERNSGGLRTAW